MAKSTNAGTFTVKEGVKIGSVGELVELINEKNQLDSVKESALWFRGITDCTKHFLEPSIARCHSFGEGKVCFNKVTELQLLHRWRRLLYDHFGRQPTLWEALFLGRHHGLPVRLLDWTSNPLAALYFACEDPVEDGAVWVLQRKKLRVFQRTHIDVFHRTDPFAIREIKLIYPYSASPRIRAQSGAFTLHSWRNSPRRNCPKCNRDACMRLECNDGRKLSDQRCDITFIRRHKVPSDCKWQILQDLERLGVNHRSLFPDLDGLAKGLLRLETLRGPVYERFDEAYSRDDLRRIFAQYGQNYVS